MTPHFKKLAAFTLALLFAFASTPLTGQDVEQLEEEAINSAIAKVEKSVLQIETIGSLDRVGKSAASSGPFTALVIDADGYLISSSYNFAHQPTSIFVKLSDGKRAACEIVARDRSRNLVLLKVDTKEKLSVPKFIGRGKLKVGGWAIAVGRTFDPSSTNISVGIISATNRIWGKAIQSDAKISPNNYGGALIDIDGNVIGILTPLSTRGAGPTAGSDWYDSGIGFAVPMDEVASRLETLKKGKDLYPGLLGVSFEGRNMYADPAKVAALGGTSPAAKAGIRVGDKITRFAGKTIRRQAELRHAVGPYYAGDTVKVTVDREGKPLEFSVTLAQKIAPYEQPFLGMLLTRKDGKFIVRHTFADSPAAKASLKTGDVVNSFAGNNNIQQAIEKWLVGSKFGEEVAIVVERDGKPVNASLKSVKVDPTLPDTVAPLVAKKEAPEYPTGIVEVKVPEEPNLCHAYVPDASFESAPGLLVWVPRPGKVDFKKFSKNWEAVCKKHNFILLVPQSAEKQKWRPDESDFIQKAVDQLKLSHTFDTSRVAIAGSGSGGSMAATTAFAHRDLVRGLAMINSPLPSRVGRISASPINRLTVLAGTFREKEKDKDGIAISKRMSTAKIPAIHTRIAGGKELYETMGLWLDCLNRF